MAKAQASKKPPVSATAVDLDSWPMRIAWWSVLALVFIVPLAMSNLSFITGPNSPPLTFDQFDIVKVFFQRFFALIGIAAWTWGFFTKGGKIRSTPVEWLILAFLAWVLLTSFTSIHPLTALFGKYRRFEGFLSFVNYAVVLFLVVQLATRMSRIRTLANTLFFSGTLVSFYGVLQFLGADPVSWGALPFEARRAFSTFGNPDLLGGFLMFPLALSLALAFSEKDRLWRAVYWGGFFLTVFCWIVAFTRGAWIGGVVVFVVLAIAFLRERVKLTVVDWTAIALVAVMAVGIVAVSLQSKNPVMNVKERVASIAVLDAGSAETRFQIWQAAIDAIKAKPIFGFGADTFRLVFPKYKPFGYVAAAGYLSVADNVHAYPLQLAAGIGIVGLLLLYGIFGWTAIRTAPVAFKKRETPDGLVLAGFWAACAGYITALMFGLSVTGASMMLWVSMGALLAATASQRDYKPSSLGTVVAVFMLVVAAFGIVGNTIYIVADHAYLNGRLANPGDPARAAAALRAVKLNPTNDIYRAEVGLAYQDELINALTQALQQQQAGQDPSQSLNVAKQRFDLAEAEMLSTIEFVPPEYDNYVFLANLYNLGGQYFDPSYYDKAIEIAKRGIEVERYGPAIRYQLAQAYQGKGQTNDAIRVLKYSMKMDPIFSDAAILLAQLYAKQGREDEAKQSLADTIKAYKGRKVPLALTNALNSYESTATSPTL